MAQLECQVDPCKLSHRGPEAPWGGLTYPRPAIARLSRFVKAFRGLRWPPRERRAGFGSELHDVLAMQTTTPTRPSDDPLDAYPVTRQSSFSDQLCVRASTGLREALQNLADRNNRSLAVEVRAALAAHVRAGDSN